MKKNHPHSLSISEIIDHKRHGYLKSIKGPVSENFSAVSVLGVKFCQNNYHFKLGERLFYQILTINFEEGSKRMTVTFSQKKTSDLVSTFCHTVNVELWERHEISVLCA